MIEVDHLSKRYGAFTAVDDVSFRVESGQILGFLGPNGAGKTTTMRIITGYMPATSGKATVAGFDVFEQPLEAKRRTGYLPETPPLYPDMTVREYLTFVAKIKGVHTHVRDRVDEVMKKTWVADMASRHCSKLSKGYKQRVGLAQAIIHNPDVLVLDEPTAGLDPRQIIETRQLIRELAGTHTIVLSTHILPEVAQTCQRVVIINKGKVVAVDSPDNLTSRMQGAATVVVQCDGPARRGDGHAAERQRCHPRHARHRQRPAAQLRSGLREGRGRPPRARLRRRRTRVGSAGAALDAHEPRGHLPQRHHRGTGGNRRADRGGGLMRNVLAMAGKELRGYFASPIGYVLVGFYALLFGWFFYTLVAFFERQSMQMAPGGPGSALNVNQMLVSPLLMNATVIMLLVFPLITMRTYAEEKRSGTMELLLTSPITDLQIILGKFLGALALFAAMLAVTLVHMAVLFVYGNPEWKPIATGYLGLLLMGGSFLSLGLLHLEPHQEPDRRRHDHLLGVPAAVGHQLGVDVRRSDGADGAQLSLHHRALRRLRQGHHRHQARCLLPQLHRHGPLPDDEVGGQRTVEGLET